jgi:hypothetical protein
MSRRIRPTRLSNECNIPTIKTHEHAIRQLCRHSVAYAADGVVLKRCLNPSVLGTPNAQVASLAESYHWSGARMRYPGTHLLAYGPQWCCYIIVRPGGV